MIDDKTSDAPAKGAEMKPDCPVVATVNNSGFYVVYHDAIFHVACKVGDKLIRQSDHLAALAERDALIKRYRNALTVIINSPGGGPAKRIATQVLGEYLARATQAASEGEGKL